MRETVCRFIGSAILILCAAGMLARVAAHGGAGGSGCGGGVTHAATAEIIYTPFGNNTIATGISADGSVIFGEYFLPSNDPQCQTFGGCTRTFRWTAATGAQDVKPIDDRTGEVQAHAINSNGTQIVGESISDLAFRRAFILTAATSTKDIGTPIAPQGPDFSTARAFGMSANSCYLMVIQRLMQ